MIERIIRIAIGATVIALLIGAVYGWTLIHTALGIKDAHYFYAVAALIGSYISYIIGDIVLTAHNTRKDM